MIRHRSVACLAALCLAMAAAVNAADSRAVSPGGEARELTVAARCPTFSWTKAPAAESYELVVYAVETAGAQRVLAERLPGSARAWTPSLDRCFRPSKRYAWSLRAVEADGRATRWAPPRLFRVASRRSADVAWDAGEEAEPIVRQAAPSPIGPEPGAPGAVPADGPREAAPPPRAVGGGVVISTTGITIEGEAVTVTDSNVIEVLGCSDGDVVIHNGIGWECGSL